MARFGLASSVLRGTSYGSSSDIQSPTRLRFDQESDEEETTVESVSEVGAQNDDLEYSDDEEEEEPHPLGFAKISGQSRYAVDLRPRDTIGTYMRRSAFAHPYEVQDSLFSEDEEPRIQNYPPLRSYIDHNTASSNDLFQYARAVAKNQNNFDEEPDFFTDEMNKVSKLLQDSTIAGVRSSSSLVTTVTTESVVEPYRLMQADRRQVQKEMESVKSRFEKDHEERRQLLKKLIRLEEEKANKIRREQERLAEQLQRDAEEREREEEARRKADEEEQEQARQVREKEEAKARAASEKEETQRAAEAKEREYLTRAQKLVSQLVQVRESVKPFEESKAALVKKRRLQMKKLVGGKINTLTENADKIRSVAADVSQAISAAREEDERIKAQLSSGSNEVSAEMARGKRYLVDLLSSKVIVRVQAEGFNGQRGDGFPLANMLAIVSGEQKELGPVLAAHIYTVCPTAIPSLPIVAPEASEEELMDSLGMEKKADGSYETFERFLSRTESIISLVADIMSSNPPTHGLLGGHQAAIKWLTRFLGHLPAPPESPLPLVTAPVLDAFLTGAGHMLANKHPEEFKSRLDEVMKDVIPRLDEGAIGAPSATRLKKTVGDGFESFKKTVPSRALPELYYGADESLASGHGTGPGSSNVFGAVASASPFGSSVTAQSSNNPFGTSSMSSASPFTSAPSQTPASAPFSQGASGGPFGGATSSSSPFSSAAPPAPGPSPFGNTASGANIASPFSSGPAVSGQGSSGASPFAMGGAPSPSPFASSAPTPFTTGSSPSPFSQPGNQGSAAAFGGGNTAPFGNLPPSTSPSPFSQSSLSPFGQPSGQPNAPGFSNSPFGSSSNAMGPQASSPFGSSNTTAQGGQSSAFSGGTSSSPSPFGAPAPSPFGNTGGFNQPRSGGGGGRGKPPCKFFAEGRCKFGAQCKFSHENPSGGGFNSPFGGPRR